MACYKVYGKRRNAIDILAGMYYSNYAMRRERSHKFTKKVLYDEKESDHC